MDTLAELDRRLRTFDPWLPPWVVATMIEHGHLDEVRSQAQSGDWYCAVGLAQFLAGRGERDGVLEVIAPFIEIGWWEAVGTAADIVDNWGCRDEAIALVRPAAEAGDLSAIKRLATLLAGLGHTDEMITLLRPYAGNQVCGRALLNLTAGCGRDDIVMALLPTVPAEPRFGEAPTVVGLPAAVLERQGRVDEALALLDTRIYHPNGASANVIEQYADILARHDRLADLREFAAGAGGRDASYRLADLLEERGHVDAAADVLRPFAAAGSPDATVGLADMLIRNDRFDEAVLVLRSASGAAAGDEWVLKSLLTLLTEHGRTEEAFAIVDDIAARSGGMSAELFFERVWLLSRCGRAEQAIIELRARPDADTRNMKFRLADLLADTGCLEEAIAMLTPTTGMDVAVLADLLIRGGRVKDAIAAWHERDTTPAFENPWAV
ncbi:tetratricopeptide repeat protein [Embleya sp. NPDC020886]|uniref:tetratricopeptide repeat protein n=1 Tax=Embleya sp. NPDC020886 TaxID=3363980 RepID=UPI0037A2D4AC